MPKVSVIVPVYNTAPFLLDCFASLAGQTMADFEVLLIENGSTDGGDGLCAHASMVDSRFRVLHQDEPGVSAARNAGLDHARGEYVFFLDSDDAFHPRLLEEMVAAADAHGAGLGVCGFQRVDSTQLSNMLNTPAPSGQPWQVGKGDTVEQWFHLEHLPQFSCIGGTLVRHSLLKDLRFDPELSLGEDTMFVYRLVCGRPVTVYSPRTWVYYRSRKGSARALQLAKQPDYLLVPRIIRDSEVQKGRVDFALRWEIEIVRRIAVKSWEMRRAKDREGKNVFDRLAQMERREPLYKELPIFYKLSLACRRFLVPPCLTKQEL